MFTFRITYAIIFLVIDMPILNLNNEKDVKKYQEYLTKHYNIMQSIEWGILKEDWYYELVYIEEENNKDILGSALVLLRKIPIINSFIAYIPRGPVLKKYSIENMKKIVKEILLLKNKYNIFLIRFDPRIEVEDQELLDYKTLFKVRGKGFSTKRNINPRLNMIIDLDSNKTIEEIFKSFSKSTKLNIKKAIKLGCVIEDITNIQGLKEFYELHLVTGKRDNFTIRSYQYFERLFNLFNPQGKIKILKVSVEGNTFGSIILLSSGDTLWYYAGASSNFQGKYKANYLLQMYAINLAKKQGYKFYDMGGIYSENPKIEPLYIFKHGFCRTTTHFIGELDYPINKFKYSLYNILEILKILKGTIKRKFINSKSTNTDTKNETELNTQILNT